MVTWPRPSSSLRAFGLPVLARFALAPAVRARREALAALAWPGPAVPAPRVRVQVATLFTCAGLVAALVVGVLSAAHAAVPVAVRSQASSAACAAPQQCAPEPLGAPEIGVIAAVAFLAVLAVGGVALVPEADPALGTEWTTR